MSRRKQTPSQTVGPFFAYGLTPGQYGYNFPDIAGSNLLNEETEGERITITGQVLDGDDVPIDDAMVEIWQADHLGRYAHPADKRGKNSAFRGFGRMGTGTDPQNRFVFQTVKPGSAGDGVAPHVSVLLFMRGGLNHMYTRIYFDGEAANAGDPVLSSVPEDRQHTLLAKEAAPGVWRFDIHMQGADETVFFDV